MGKRRETIVMLAILLLARTAVTAPPATQPDGSILQALPNGTCAVAQCGMGTCRAGGSILGFSCECFPGWTKFDVTGLFSFFPCLIPNCTVNFSCSNATSSPSPPPPPPQPVDPLRSFFNSCGLSFCGEGDCVSTSSLTFRCDCRPGYSNLLNSTVLPCVQECFLGANCPPLFTSPAPPPIANVSNSASAPSFSLGMERLFWLCSWIIILAFSA